jgi:hypothetical protein
MRLKQLCAQAHMHAHHARSQGDALTGFTFDRLAAYLD